MLSLLTDGLEAMAGWGGLLYYGIILVSMINKVVFLVGNLVYFKIFGFGFVNVF